VREIFSFDPLLEQMLVSNSILNFCAFMMCHQFFSSSSKGFLGCAMIDSCLPSKTIVAKCCSNLRNSARPSYSPQEQRKGNNDFSTSPCVFFGVQLYNTPATRDLK